MGKAFTLDQLRREAEAYSGHGGRSEELEGLDVRPAFLDRDTGRMYLSCSADGTPAPVHVLDGLPTELVVRRDARGRVTAVKPGLVSGFCHRGRFVSRAEAMTLANRRSR